jgi:hypothetical protein
VVVVVIGLRDGADWPVAAGGARGAAAAAAAGAAAELLLEQGSVAVAVVEGGVGLAKLVCIRGGGVMVLLRRGGGGISGIWPSFGLHGRFLEGLAGTARVGGGAYQPCVCEQESRSRNGRQTRLLQQQLLHYGFVSFFISFVALIFEPFVTVSVLLPAGTNANANSTNDISKVFAKQPW